MHAASREQVLSDLLERMVLLYTCLQVSNDVEQKKVAVNADFSMVLNEVASLLTWSKDAALLAMKQLNIS